jgi:tetratricopeptide (TPR) repeat protein
MDAALAWTIAGSAAGVLATGLAAWQVRLQLAERRMHEWESSQGGELGVVNSGGGLPVTAPVGRLPSEVRGRSDLVGELSRRVRKRPKAGGGTWVLAGMGGLGKSTVALAIAEQARVRGWLVWWVNAGDATSLTGGMLEVLHQLGAPASVTQPVREGAPTAAERAWDFLNGHHQTSGRWLLIFDNADLPGLLAPAGASPADYTGWLRPDPAGLLIVTTRVKDPRIWGPRVNLRELSVLDVPAAARALADLAPDISDPGGEQARELARRLGGLPLALHLVGSYLASPFARWHTFDEYRAALDNAADPGVLADLDDPAGQARATISRTWDLSLEALAADGRPQARPLLLLLSCFAAATEIPAALLQPGPAVRLLSTGADGSVPDDSGRLLREGLTSLAAVGLVELRTGVAAPALRGVTVHPVVADVNRARLLASPEHGLTRVITVAIDLVRAVTTSLDYKKPGDWPTWKQIVPHVTAMLGWCAARIDTALLATLLEVSDPAGDALWRSGDHVDAERLAQLMVDAAARLGNDHPASLTARNALASRTAEQGRYARAEQMYREVLAARVSVLGADHQATLRTRHRLADAVTEQGRNAEAEELQRRLIADQVRVLGAEHPDTLETREALAWSVGRQYRHKEAEQIDREVLAAQSRVLGMDHPDTLHTRNRLAWLLIRQELHDDGKAIYEGLLPDCSRVLGDEHPHTLKVRHTIAWLTALQGHHQDAERLYRNVLPDRQRILGPQHPETLLTASDLAWVIGLQGRYAEAERLYQAVLADRTEVLGPDHPQTQETRQELKRMSEARTNHALVKPR